MNTNLKTSIGIDLGGTKIEGVVIAEDGTVLQRRRIPTPGNDYEAILDAIASLVASLTDDPTRPVGIGTPGSVSRISPLMRNANSTCLNGRPLAEDLARHLGRKIFMANDADCFALSEAVDGAGAGSTSVFGVILGTGVGGGLVINGQLVTGINGIAGEWGHNPLPMTGNSLESRDCFCGRRNCIETWLSGPGLQRTYRERTGRTLRAEEIAAARESGDADAAAVLEQYCEHLAAALSVVINIFDPATIVLGGGLSNLSILYEQVPAHLPRHVFSDHVATRLARAEHGDSSGVRGAAWLVGDH